jgi:hypothetical protein
MMPKPPKKIHKAKLEFLNKRQREATKYHWASSKRKSLKFLSLKVGFDNIFQGEIEKSFLTISFK